MMPLSHPIRSWKITAAALTLGVVALASSARAAVQFADGFAYTTGTLGTDGPPAGAPAGQTGWTPVSGSTQVTSTSLSYPGIVSSGNKATITGAAGANGDISAANLSLAGTAGNGVEWIGFLVNEASGGTAPGGYAVLDVNNNGGTGPAFGMLFGQNVYGIDNDTADVERSSTGIGVNGTTHLLVGELNFATGTTYLFVDPSLAGTPSNASANASLAMTAAFQASGFNEVVVAAGFNTAAFNLDQIKVGTTFADVVPEPSATWLIAVAAAGWAGWRALARRRLGGQC